MPRHTPYFFGQHPQKTCLFKQDNLILYIQKHNDTFMTEEPYLLTLEQNNRVLTNHEIYLSTNGRQRLINSASTGAERLINTLNTMGYSSSLIASVISKKLELDFSDKEMALSSFGQGSHRARKFR